MSSPPGSPCHVHCTAGGEGQGRGFGGLAVGPSEDHPRELRSLPIHEVLKDSMCFSRQVANVFISMPHVASALRSSDMRMPEELRWRRLHKSRVCLSRLLRADRSMPPGPCAAD
eukprot:3152145-Pleurochrysis_carterae.AAC.1